MKMYLVNLHKPWSEPRLIDVQVKVCPKTVWAIDTRGGRHLIGSSTFQTLAAANRCRKALLEKFVDSSYNKFMRPHIVTMATRLLPTLH